MSGKSGVSNFYRLRWYVKPMSRREWAAHPRNQVAVRGVIFKVAPNVVVLTHIDG